MTPTELRNYVIDNPQSVTDLFLDGHEDSLWNWLTPDPINGFTIDQRLLLDDLWLLADLDTINLANSILSIYNKQIFSMTTISSDIVITCDLLTDCLPVNSTWNPIAHILVGLPIVLRLPTNLVTLDLGF
jgi:hypothetical protein